MAAAAAVAAAVAAAAAVGVGLDDSDRKRELEVRESVQLLRVRFADAFHYELVRHLQSRVDATELEVIGRTNSFAPAHPVCA